jgi:hypothetical protein
MSARHEARAKVRSSDEEGRGGTVDSRPGRLRQRKPQPLAPHPRTCPVRASAPSRRHRATSAPAPAYHSSYLRNCHSFKGSDEARSRWRLVAPPPPPPSGALPRRNPPGCHIIEKIPANAANARGKTNDQLRTSVPQLPAASCQLPLRRSANPPGRGPLR